MSGQDYIVARYARHYDLGVSDADMELTAVRIRKKGELHAVRLVRHQGRVYLLDNLLRDTQGPERLKDFEVVYFISRMGGIPGSLSNCDCQLLLHVLFSSGLSLVRQAMATAPNNQELCPYCDSLNPAMTDDHIFPQFMGGKRTIRVCRECNNTFGHSFEGMASKQIKCLQVFISHFGLDLTRNPATWPSALDIADVTYDLISGPAGAQYLLSKPVIYRDAVGRITGGKARSESEAKKIAKGMVNAGHAREIEISPSVDKPFDEMTLTGPFSFNPDLYRFATKLTAAVLIAFDFRRIVSLSEIPAYLHGKDAYLTTPAYCDISPILKLRTPMTHTVYVELSSVSYAIVLIFGFMKIYIPLPPTSDSVAMLAMLDPMTGDETFQKVEPVGARSVPQYIEGGEALAHFREMSAILTQDAIAKGAKFTPKLELKDVDLGEPRVVSWTDSTVRYMFPNKAKDKE